MSKGLVFCVSTLLSVFSSSGRSLCHEKQLMRLTKRNGGSLHGAHPHRGARGGPRAALLCQVRTPDFVQAPDFVRACPRISSHGDAALAARPRDPADAEGTLTFLACPRVHVPTCPRARMRVGPALWPRRFSRGFSMCARPLRTCCSRPRAASKRN